MDPLQKTSQDPDKLDEPRLDLPETHVEVPRLRNCDVGRDSVIEEIDEVYCIVEVINKGTRAETIHVQKYNVQYLFLCLA